MFTKAGLLIAVALVLLGYRWGKRRAQERLAPPRAQSAPAAGSAPAEPKRELISVKALLVIVAVLLLIAILSSLGGKIG